MHELVQSLTIHSTLPVRGGLTYPWIPSSGTAKARAFSTLLFYYFPSFIFSLLFTAFPSLQDHPPNEPDHYNYYINNSEWVSSTNYKQVRHVFFRFSSPRMGFLSCLLVKQCTAGGREILMRRTPEIELYRLEQRYVRRKHRSDFHTGVQYVDGEYVYTNGLNSPTGTVSKQSTGSYWKPPSWNSRSR